MSRWKTYRAIWMICMALGWWGIWFPELAVWTESICVAEGDITEQNSRAFLRTFMSADKAQIRMKSRLLETVEMYLQNYLD